MTLMSLKSAEMIVQEPNRNTYDEHWIKTNRISHITPGRNRRMLWF